MQSPTRNMSYTNPWDVTCIGGSTSATQTVESHTWNANAVRSRRTR
jgi:hypothetical protein